MVAAEGSMSAAVDKILSRGSVRSGSWGWGRPGALAELRQRLTSEQKGNIIRSTGNFDV
jgi:hypothetical protein